MKFFGDMMEKSHDSSMYFPIKNGDTHYLLVRKQLANSENYPLRNNKVIKSKVIGKAVVFFNQEDEDNLLKMLNSSSESTFEQLIKDELEDYGDPSKW